MNCACLVLCLIAAVVVTDAFPPKFCKTNDDCNSNDKEKRCCVKPAGDFYPIKFCKSERKQGKECYPQDKADVYDFKCPCAGGLECVGEPKNPKPVESDSGSSESSNESDNVKYVCRIVEASSAAPEASSAQPEPEPSQEPKLVSHPEPEVEEENVEIPEQPVA